MSEPEQKFGPELARLRKDRGFSIRGLAEAAGLDAANLCKIEKGKQSPPATMRFLRILIAPLKLHQDEIYYISELAVLFHQRRVELKFWRIK